jgi:diadenosine tetraphosphate (Ap4A) HIT family hydrolase
MVERIGGALWRTPAIWALRRSRGGCPICRRGRPREVIATLPASWVTAPTKAPLPGYIAVVAKRHVVEPFELPPSARRAFWDDVMFAAEVLAGIFSPVKMNYELHGNTVPHLHVHLYPRYRDDPFVGGPIDPRHTTFARSRDDLRHIGRAIRNARSPDRRDRSRGRS